jgi:hypothetical protein
MQRCRGALPRGWTGDWVGSNSPAVSSHRTLPVHLPPRGCSKASMSAGVTGARPPCPPRGGPWHCPYPGSRVALATRPGSFAADLEGAQPCRGRRGLPHAVRFTLGTWIRTRDDFSSRRPDRRQPSPTARRAASPAHDVTIPAHPGEIWATEATTPFNNEAMPPVLEDQSLHSRVSGHARPQTVEHSAKRSSRFGGQGDDASVPSDEVIVGAIPAMGRAILCSSAHRWVS